MTLSTLHKRRQPGLGHYNATRTAWETAWWTVRLGYVPVCAPLYMKAYSLLQERNRAVCTCNGERVEHFSAALRPKP